MEIERSADRLLDGGRPVDAVLREGKKDSSERVVAHLNVQVWNVMPLLCQNCHYQYSVAGVKNKTDLQYTVSSY